MPLDESVAVTAKTTRISEKTVKRVYLNKSVIKRTVLSFLIKLKFLH